MSRPQFVPFPKTPHLAGSSVVDDDETVDVTTLSNVFQRSPLTRVLVQEKVDGSNVSVHFEEEWFPIVQKRSGLIEMGERRQYQVFREYVQTNMEMFFSMLGTRYCLFGEWLWAQHNVSYDALPNYLIVFDIYDKEQNKFLTYNRIIEVVGERIPIVPVIVDVSTEERQNVGKLIGEITAKLEQKSHFGSAAQEGVYVRFEDDQCVKFRAKLRRKTFTSGRSDFDTNVINNMLAPASAFCENSPWRLGGNFSWLGLIC